MCCNYGDNVYKLVDDMGSLNYPTKHCLAEKAYGFVQISYHQNLFMRYRWKH